VSLKVVKHPGYNYIFTQNNGFFMRWGNTIQDDPQVSPLGPELLDIELSTVCHQGCRFCYKGNTADGYNMSLDTFKGIIDKAPSNLTQIAFGIGDIDGNPDLPAILEYTRSKGVIPNITINGFRMTPRYYDILSKLCGAVAVSYYDKDVCFTALHELRKRGITQNNIHALLSEETLDDCVRLITEVSNTKAMGLEVNAIVFLAFKPKGRGQTSRFSKVKDTRSYQRLLQASLDRQVTVGFDSCSAHNVINSGVSVDASSVEPCESTLFSYYINAKGIGFPCSFTENVCDGVDVVHSGNFMNEVWNNRHTIAFRNRLLTNYRRCPIYEV
jgi:MoaA/NifB/PqqE/SkfB family radical SAM enzyme